MKKETYMNLDEIDQILSDYRAKKLHLKEVLEFFQVEFFHNWVYSNCTDELTEIVTVEEASIYCLLNYRDQLTPLLTYPELAKWKQLCDYVEVLYNKNRRSLRNSDSFGFNDELFRVSNINWDTYDLWIRPVPITERMWKSIKFIDGYFVNPPQEETNYIIATDRLLNVLNNIAIKNGVQQK